MLLMDNIGPSTRKILKFDRTRYSDGHLLRAREEPKEDRSRDVSENALVLQIAGSATHIAAANSHPNPGAGEKAIFRREDRYWVIDFAGKLFRLKHTKGMACIAYLLTHPGTGFHALYLCQTMEDGADPGDLSGSLATNREELEVAGIHIGGLGDAGEMLDRQAKASYRARLTELREQLDESLELGHSERAARIENEIDMLKAELARAVGLGGRDRRAASAAERARQRVKKAIQTAIDGIGKLDGGLGSILARCIRTGTYCSYIPDPEFAIEWQLNTAGGSLTEFARSDRRPESNPQSPVEMIAGISRAMVRCPDHCAFAGRLSELAQLRALIEGAQRGQGSVALVGGGLGVGKTRLALEAANYACDRGLSVLIGHCYESEAALAYLPFAEIIELALNQAAIAGELRSAAADNALTLAPITPCLRRLYPGLRSASDLPPQQSRRDLFQALCETLARMARKMPLCIVLEDLHWAHESTLALLVHLAYRVPHLPIVVIATYRNIDLMMDSALARTLDELHRGGVNQLRLCELSESEVGVLLRGLSHRELPQEFVKLVFDATDGNPFFAEELYRHLVESNRAIDSCGHLRADFELKDSDVPESVRLAVGRRLERLGASGKRVLTAAAVLGRRFSFRLLKTFLGEVDLDDLLTAIERAYRMGLLAAGSEQPQASYRFSHEIVRRTLLADISPPRRQLLDLQAAAAIRKTDCVSMVRR